MFKARRLALFALALLIALARADEIKKPSEPSGAQRADLQGDPLPVGVLARMGTIRFRHGTQVQFLQYSRDGKVLASLGVDQTIRLWETASGKELRTFRIPETANAPFALSPDGKYLASTNFARIRIWDAKTGKELHAIDDPNGNATSIVFSPDGKTLAVNSGADEVQLIDVATGKERKRLKGPQNQGYQGFFHQQLSFAPDGNTLAIAGLRDNKTVIDFVSVVSGNKSHDIDLVQPNVPFLVHGPDHKTLATWGFDQDLHILDMKTGKELHKFNMPQGVIALTYSADGKYLAACSGNDAFGIWDVTTGKEENPDEVPKMPVTATAFAPDGKAIAIAGTGSIIRFLDVKKGTDLHKVVGHTAALDQVMLSPDGKTLATLADDHTVRLWETATARQIRMIEGPSVEQPGLPLGGTAEFSADGKHLAVAWSSTSLILYDAGTGKEVRTFGNTENPPGFSCVSFTPDGKFLAAACDDGVVRLWDTRTGKERRHFPDNPVVPDPHPNPVAAEGADGSGLSLLAFSPNGMLMVTLGGDPADAAGAYSILTVWELATGKERQRIRFKDADDVVPRAQETRLGGIAPTDPSNGAGVPGNSMVVSPDGRFVALTTGSAVRLIDLGRGKEIRQFGAQGEWLSSATFSPDGKTLAAGAADGTVRFWEVATGTALGEFRGHRGQVTALVYAADGKTIATGSSDTTAMIWDVAYLMRALKTTRAALSSAELEQLARDLAGDDAQKAGRAIWTLVESPQQALPFLREHVRAAEKIDQKKLAKLIQDLNSEEFDERKSASEELTKLGERAEPALRKRLEEKPELEEQTRIEELLEKLQRPVTSPELLSALRMVEILEHIGNPDARKLLEKISKGAEGSRLTREASAALERLSKRAAP